MPMIFWRPLPKAFNSVGHPELPCGWSCPLGGLLGLLGCAPLPCKGLSPPRPCPLDSFPLSPGLIMALTGFNAKILGLQAQGAESSSHSGSSLPPVVSLWRHTAPQRAFVPITAQACPDQGDGTSKVERSRSPAGPSPPQVPPAWAFSLVSCYKSSLAHACLPQSQGQLPRQKFQSHPVLAQTHSMAPLLPGEGQASGQALLVLYIVAC